MGHFRNCWSKGTILDTKKGLPLSLVVKIWIFIAFSSTANGNTSSVSYSMPVVNHSTVTESVSWSLNASISESYIDVMNVTATMSHVMSNSVPVSSSPMLPPHCYRVCNCNNSVGYATSSMKYNMTLHSSSAMYNVTVSAMGNMSSMPYSDDYNMSSGSMNASPHVSPSPSSSGMAYTPSTNVTPMHYSSTPWPAPSSSVSEPFHCPNVSCWVEIECMSHTHSISKTSYVSTSSVPPTVCSGVVDCNGDCGGSAEEDCGICYGGNTKNENPRDCDNQCNGNATNSSDTCFKCLLAGEDNVFKDCNNDCHGNAALDDCHVCTGGNTRKMANHLKDACGVCNGTNSTCIGCDGVPNSGLVFDACGKCGGNGTTCTALTTTVPQTIASGQPKVWVIGAGFDAGNATVCVLYNPDSGVEVVNTTATQRNLTHAHCVFQPWTNYTAGKYNLSVILVHDGGEQIKLNESVPIYYYNSSNLALRNVTPYEILKDDLPEYVTLVGNGFFDWKETVCYFNSSESKEIIFLNETHLKCKAPAAVTSTRFTVSLSMDGGLNTVGSAILTAYSRAPNVTTVKFSDTASSILVLFDIDIDIANDDETCENLFSAEVVLTFGIDADCYLSSWREVTILLGAGANITTGDNLVFKDNVFQAYGETYSEFYSGSVPVQGPDDPLRPTPVITGKFSCVVQGDLISNDDKESYYKYLMLG